MTSYSPIFHDAKVSPTSLEAMFPDYSSFLIEPLHNFFGGAPLEMFEVFREGGRARAANVVKGEDQYYVMELALSNPQSGESHLHFDRARYRLLRLKSLKQLGKHYPETFFLRTDGPWTEDGPQQLLIVLQEFISYPVCKFTDYEAVLELLRILKLSASFGMLLDYNQNHWLYKKANEHLGHLYYVDKDYVDDGRPFESAVRVGFDQSTMFLTLQNALFYARALTQLAKEKSECALEFTKIIRDQIEQNVDSLRSRKQTRIVQNRIKSLELILDQLPSG
ncbi:MAG: hypothetical protein ACFFB3_00155 [Candidatus Hodarchaeota archaeon]